ncbi:uncharacterized protein LOC129597064 [Paramacrobiotus metropolitanus]|uniref:uncharacterized protein LOC129597064 n=1 Tax=Paramacrobiotus metropolitanus TaxID=2943436 RepID=UPI0024458D7B|nr:uncharacterized protein LOC129597064 [Paramacrobiotus metropolitanus]
MTPTAGTKTLPMFVTLPFSMYIAIAVLFRGYAADTSTNDPRYYLAKAVNVRSLNANPRSAMDEGRPHYASGSASPLEGLAGAYYLPKTWFIPSVISGSVDAYDSDDASRDLSTGNRNKKGSVYSSKELPRRDTGAKVAGASYTKPPQNYNFFRLIG